MGKSKIIYRRTSFKCGLMIAFADFAYNANLMIASADAAVYSVLLLDLFLRYQMIVNRRKTRNSNLIDTCNQNQSYSTSEHMHVKNIIN